MSAAIAKNRVRLKFRAHVEMGQSPPSSDYSANPEIGLPFLQGTAEFGDYFPVPTIYCETNPKSAQKGDILFSVRAPVGQLNQADRDYGIGRGLCAIRAAHEDYNRYLWWALLESRNALSAVETGTTYKAVSAEDVSNLEIADKDIQQARVVACYLESETTTIDTLIEAKQKLLGLLAEKRRTLVAEAVMRGLDSSAPLRPSGIDWLGDIPAHWEIERSRWLFNERDERSETGGEEMLTVSHITGVTPRSQKDVNMFEAETTAGYKLCFTGDLVINTLWAWMGAMGTAPVDGICSPAYNVYTPGNRLMPDYVDALVRIPVFAKEVTRYSKGVWSSRLRLYPEGFFETFWPVPPLDEQEQIVARIAEERMKIDKLATATERSIGLLKERRSALIAAAVTGQIDIPEAA